MTGNEKQKNERLVLDWAKVRVPAGFPLAVHKSKAQFYKVINGKPRYFGKLPDWRAAQAIYESERADWAAGRNPRLAAEAGDGRVRVVTSKDDATIEEIAQAFLVSMGKRRELPPNHRRHLGDRSYVACKRTIKRMLAHFGRRRLALGITPDDWLEYRAKIETGQTLRVGDADRVYPPLSIDGVRGYVVYIRQMSRWASNPDVDKLPRGLRFGDNFDRPSKDERRESRRQRVKERGCDKLHAKEHIPLILKACKGHGHQVHSMFLLSLNCAFTSGDCARLEWGDIDFAEGYIDLSRTKRGSVARPFLPLWNETIETLIKVKASDIRCADEQYRNLVFRTRCGMPWVRERTKNDDKGDPSIVIRQDAVCIEFYRILKALGIKKHGINFGTGRHTFRTSAGGSKDIEAVNFLMGHRQREGGAECAEWYTHIDEDAKSRMWVVVKHVYDRLMVQTTAANVPAQRLGLAARAAGGGEEAAAAAAAAIAIAG